VQCDGFIDDLLQHPGSITLFNGHFRPFSLYFLLASYTSLTNNATDTPVSKIGSKTSIQGLINHNYGLFFLLPMANDDKDDNK
jgi:hypothetical protein